LFFPKNPFFLKNKKKNNKGENAGKSDKNDKGAVDVKN